MNKNVDNVFVPKFIPNNLKWYERDGLNTWYEQGKCQDFLDDLDSHFENLEIVYFALIHSKGNLPETKIKQYQTVNHSEFSAYPSDKQGEILSSLFRIKRKYMNVAKESINEHFKKPIKSYGRYHFIKIIKTFIIRKAGSVNCIF